MHYASQENLTIVNMQTADYHVSRIDYPLAHHDSNYLLGELQNMQKRY